MVDPVLVRRIAGTASVVLLIAVGYVVMSWRYGPPPGSYEVTAVLGSAGSGLTEGSDVKVRGVRIGEVATLHFVDGVASATLRLDAQPQLPAPEDLELVVTAKTLLGEKQIELSFPDGRLGEQPFLEPGDELVAARQPAELAAVLDTLSPFLDAIDPEDLAVVVEALGQQEGSGEIIARNLEVGSDLAQFGERTADQALRNLNALADIADELAPRAVDLTRMNTRIDEATAVLTTRQADLRRVLEVTQDLARVFGEYLEVEEPLIEDLLRTGDPIGAMFERRASEFAGLLDGLAVYFETLGRGGLLVSDGTEYAPFRILLDREAFSFELLVCQFVPLPDCPEPGLGDDAPDGGGGA